MMSLAGIVGMAYGMGAHNLRLVFASFLLFVVAELIGACE